MYVNEFRVIIAGSREFDDYELLKKYCNYYLSNKINNPDCRLIIVSGHAKGADSLGERYAQEFGIPCEIFPANWDKYGKSAGYRRNLDMARVSNAAIIFLSAYAENKGSLHMIDIAKENKLLVRVVKEDE
jgi:hypothetical protein